MDADSHPTPLKVCPIASALIGEMPLSGDKSISHRIIMVASLAKGVTRISGLLEGQDVLRTIKALQDLGINIYRGKENIWHVHGKGLNQFIESGSVLEMGNSGTTARLLAGILATQPLASFLSGDCSLNCRPMRRVIDPLTEMGAKFISRTNGTLPMAIQGTKSGKAISYTVPVASAQVKSALLLAGLNVDGKTELFEPMVTRDHTENMLRYFGADITQTQPDHGGQRICLQGPVRLKAKDFRVPSDPSSAAFAIVAALLVPGSHIIIRHVGLNPLRTGLIRTLTEMGADIRITNQCSWGWERVGDLEIYHSHLHGIQVPSERAPSMIDEYPILAVAAAYANGESQLHGLQELRLKESDRLASIEAMLASVGVQAASDGDTLTISGIGGRVPGKGKIETFMDHRLAMSGCIMGLLAENPIEIDDISLIHTSFPGFFRCMDMLGAGFCR